MPQYIIYENNQIIGRIEANRKENALTYARYLMGEAVRTLAVHAAKETDREIAKAMPLHVRPAEGIPAKTRYSITLPLSPEGVAWAEKQSNLSGAVAILVEQAAKQTNYS
jgi:hypothetical protein